MKNGSPKRPPAEKNFRNIVEVIEARAEDKDDVAALYATAEEYTSTMSTWHAAFSYFDERGKEIESREDAAKIRVTIYEW